MYVTYNLHYLYFSGWFFALNISLLELPSVFSVGHEISVHDEVSDACILSQATFS